MAIKYEVFKKDRKSLHAQFSEVQKLANKLRACLDKEPVQRKLKERNVLGASSSNIQNVILEDAIRLGFQSEKENLFKDYEVGKLRPDYFKSMGNTGIILEVERGKTISNNMDLLDLWKCHICDRATFLFLVVPIERPTKNNRPTQTFSTASRRLSSFFEPENYVNVDAVFLFGY